MFRASDAIRSLDNETLIFWEPTTYAYIADLDPGIDLLEEQLFFY